MTEEAKKKIENVYKHSSNSIEKIEAAKFGYALASQEHREEWVRVDAGKPGMFGKYIVYTQWGCNILWFGFNPEERYYEDRYPEMATNFWRYARPDEAEEIILFDDVTHWMPLPTPPHQQNKRYGTHLS